MSLLDDLREAENRVDQLKRQIMASTCIELGACDMQSHGGCNAGCCDECICHVPVHVCSRCGDCDYGQNAEADEVRRNCEGVDVG